MVITPKIFKGTLKRTGAGVIYSGATNYSVVQIDKKILTNLRVPHKIDSFMDIGSEIELKVMRLPFTWLKFAIGINTSEVKLKSNYILVTSIGFYVLCALPFYFIVTSKPSALEVTGMQVYGILLLFELWNIIVAFKD